MKKLVMMLTLITASNLSIATDIQVPVVGVYDGDTIYSNLYVLPSPLNKVSIRLYGIDTPELRTKCEYEKSQAKLAKLYLESILLGQEEVIVKDVQWDKYGGRIDGKVFLLDGTDVSQKMLDSGLATPYFGGTRKDWCTETSSGS
jgi:endonuclease YncB( thermonuclease family)